MKVFAVLSDHRAHKSASPVMHNAVIKGRGLDSEYCYVAFEIKENELERAIAGIRALNLAGANVTIPYKERVFNYLDEISDNARKAGAVNTIIRSGDKLIGDNSDIGGFIDALGVSGIEPRGKTICIVGNGGAARGLIVGLQDAGAARIIIAGRNKDRAKTLAAEFSVDYTAISELDKIDNTLNILVNATAVSTREESPELADALSALAFSQLECIVDINYGRTDTIWENIAAKTDSTFIDGRPMLALQARISFKLWTGIEVTKAEYLKALGIDYTDEIS